jgi:CrcB protein
MSYLWVALGGALGSLGRYWFSAILPELVGRTFPWATILVNIGGSFVIGLFATLTGPEGSWLVPTDARAFVIVGVCGGFTTFSSFSLETLNLARNGEWLAAGGNILFSVTLCMIAVWLGYAVAVALSR